VYYEWCLMLTYILGAPGLALRRLFWLWLFAACGRDSYHIDRFDLPVRQQGIRPDGGVRLENDVWLGAGVSVLGGVRMGQGSIAGAGAVVTRSVPARAVCLGVPARVVRQRGPQ